MSVFFLMDAGGETVIHPLPLLTLCLCVYVCVCVFFPVVLWEGGKSDELRPGKAVRVQRSWLFSGESAETIRARRSVCVCVCVI